MIVKTKPDVREKRNAGPAKASFGASGFCRFVRLGGLPGTPPQSMMGQGSSGLRIAQGKMNIVFGGCP
jgi:hypothetical protein